MAITLTNQTTKRLNGIISYGSYVGDGSGTRVTLPIGFMPAMLTIITRAGEKWQWRYGMGWNVVYNDSAGTYVQAQVIIQFPGPEAEANPDLYDTDDYTETRHGIISGRGPYAFSGDTVPGVIIEGTNVQHGTYVPNQTGTVYYFWAMG